MDIPSDASPAFQIDIGDDAPHSANGLLWRVRLSLLVAVAAESSISTASGIRTKHLRRNGVRGEWGSAWTAPLNIAPLELPKPDAEPPMPVSWTQYLVSALKGDGKVDRDSGVADDEEGDGETAKDYGGGNDGWRELRVETVECEVPINVWPGNTAFKAVDVVFTI